MSLGTSQAAPRAVGIDIRRFSRPAAADRPTAGLARSHAGGSARPVSTQLRFGSSTQSQTAAPRALTTSMRPRASTLAVSTVDRPGVTKAPRKQVRPGTEPTLKQPGHRERTGEAGRQTGQSPEEMPPPRIVQCVSGDNPLSRSLRDAQAEPVGLLARDPQLLKKSFAMVTELLENPYAGISVENLLQEMARLETELATTRADHGAEVHRLEEELNKACVLIDERDAQIRAGTAACRKLEQATAAMTTQMAAEAQDRRAIQTSLDMARAEIESLHAQLQEQDIRLQRNETRYNEAAEEWKADARRMQTELDEMDGRLRTLNTDLETASRTNLELEQMLADGAEMNRSLQEEMLQLTECNQRGKENERALRAQLITIQEEVAKYRAEEHKRASAGLVQDFGRTSADLRYTLAAVDASSQTVARYITHEELHDAQECIAELERTVERLQTAYSGLSVVTGENGSSLVGPDNVEVRVVPCEHCERGIDFQQALIDLTDLHKYRTEWLVDMPVLREENKKLKLAIVELGRRLKAAEERAASAPSQTDDLAALAQDLEPDPVADENRTLNLANLPTLPKALSGKPK
ncbi:putative Spindle pole protein [Giardia muris]|uniref:Putative Spindle pole protein n=1 Tax=Giardia muris TaxID=5742 RepID=A0A4Z1TBJ6_GIAMU|nr:putative Spindle pole protein [Giardia muris]|eukprot:TNJ29899.1 putative Spindle pole protein [Giardia muris]